ncbi:hypothetical protein ACO03V_13870 [Microbacterium sp. HMH0099]|uniref:hypothetical protein n=1 Tax=Microbacterium sp. HMH0099 TaxID=3414026 RepID=UPI003BF699BF
MDDEVRDELARLRARAFGPDADITADPAAVARLSELEEQERLRRATAPDATPSGPADGLLPDDGTPDGAAAAETPAAGIGTPADTTGTDSAGATTTGADPADPTDPAPHPAHDADADPDEDAEGAASTSPGRRRRRRPAVRSQRTLWLWAGTIAAVAAVTSAATAVGTTFAPVSRSAGVAQVDTLQVDPSFVPPPLFWPTPDGVTGYDDFFGLTAVVGALRVYSDDAENLCLYLVPSEDIADTDSSYRGGQVYGGCGAGVFAPTAQLVVSDDAPAELQERFPVGTSLQFVLDGERIGVFSDAE